MLDWLLGTIGGWFGAVSSAVADFVKAVVGPIVGFLDSLFGNVAGAWRELAGTVSSFEGMLHGWLSEAWRVFDKILTYYIPTYAMTAWWWVTNPDALAEVLLFHTLRWLELQAWTVAQYLGEFALAMVWRNLRRLALLAETIVAAIF